MSYPPEYQEAIERAADSTELRIPCDSGSAVRTLRSNFYAYRAHLRRTHKELAAIADSLEFVRDGKELVIHRKSPLGASVIREALSKS